MSGGNYYVGGIEITFPGSYRSSDMEICSALYELAEFTNDDAVRGVLQAKISQCGALELPPVSVNIQSGGYGRTPATISTGWLQIKIPNSSPSPAITPDTQDIAICTAILHGANLINDASLRASVDNAARAGLESIAQLFAGDVAQFSASPGAAGTAIKQTVVAEMPVPVYGIAGHYSEQDGTQYIIVATADGMLYEMHRNQCAGLTAPQKLLRSPGTAPLQYPDIASLAGFYTSDDGYQHLIVALHNGVLHELYFKDASHVQLRSPLVSLNTQLGSHVGMAAFFSPDDGLRHATVGGKDNVLREVAWSGSPTPSTRNLPGQFIMSDLAGIAGFCDSAYHSRNVIVAMKNGNVSAIHYGGGIMGGGQIVTTPVKKFASTLVNVAAFVATDTGYRHVIVLDNGGQLYDYAYSPEQVSGQTPLYKSGDVIDIVGYYSADDRMCHVMFATDDKKIHEVTYRSK